MQKIKIIELFSGIGSQAMALRNIGLDRSRIMKRIKIYFMEIVDLNDGVHQIKSDDYNKIWAFVKRHKGAIKGLHSGSKTVSEKKFEEIKKEENFR